MKLPQTLLRRVALMICGNEPFDHCFPYLSSYYLTGFFRHLDLDFTHDGTTRAIWVTDVLATLNTEEPGEVISRDLARVILHLVHPDRFEDLDKQPTAVRELNKLLSRIGLSVQLNSVDCLPHMVRLDGIMVSTDPMAVTRPRRLEFAPAVFELPSSDLELDLVSVMMPFRTDFNPVFTATRDACAIVGFRCLRADDIWRASIILQDVFELIYSSAIVIVDFTGRNPNVMYETGIAHTLGKVVIPITQHLEDVPSDLAGYRVLRYLNNGEGLVGLKHGLTERLKTTKSLIRDLL